MKRIIPDILILIAFVAPVMAGTALEEVNTKFTYKNKPIHPFLIGEFIGWMSDQRPIVTVVDVSAAFDTNEYPNSQVKRQYGQWWAVREERCFCGDLTEYDDFGYKWLGKMADNVHVVEIGNGGGGSGYFMYLVFVKFSEGQTMWEGKKQEQLLMSLIGIYSLGDRYNGKIKVYQDKVIIYPSKYQFGGGSIDKKIELKFPEIVSRGEGE
ncbi:MAG: hypothetical protein FJZ16_00625 [Candidatus Omnitrophica bacterium]|nr:hypothetical protein [Candidatus Omnitrophota bacterium]